MTLEVELADGTVHTYSDEYFYSDEDGEHVNETYIHRIDDNEELVVLRVRNGADGPYAEHEVARYSKNTWCSVGESNS
ncbi:hypothetical protein [Nitrolancea hollandica]|uniref:Uncharacterized protein n=1 Tax=Nitrolancea hollandica Lb TaxID=1129897 RepID=I4EJH1_9BACT|nr:hypothetical protein [Nitrolancea hollandica]CCF84833.1 hypothetical protein NITHO_4030002 [Nitrolancea hollandica Lb]